MKREIRYIAIEGVIGARSDRDVSGKTTTITGPSALLGASTNQTGGNLVIHAGQKATGGGSNGQIIMDELPTSDPSVAGALWNNSNVMNISAG